MASKKDPFVDDGETVVSDGIKWSEKILANPTLMQRAEKRTGKKGSVALHPLWNDEHPDHMKIKKAHEEYKKKIEEDAKKRSGLKGSLAWGPPNSSGRGGKRRRKTHRKKRKKKKRKTKKRRKKTKTKNKTRRKRGRGNAFKRTANAAAVGAVVLGSSAAAAQNTQLPNAEEFEETKYQLCRADPNSREGRKLFRQLALKHHPDKYSPALRAEATVNFQTLNSAFQGSRLNCVRRTRKNKPNPPKPTPPKPTPPKKKPPKREPPKREPPKREPPKREPPKRKPPKRKPPKPERKPGESAKGARKRIRAENYKISKAAATLGVVASTFMIQKVHRAKRAFRLGKEYLGEDPSSYVNNNGVVERITLYKIIEYVSGRHVDDDIVDAIEQGEYVIQDEEWEEQERRAERYGGLWRKFTHA